MIRRKLSPNLLHAISSHATKSKHASDYQIEGCTEIRLHSQGETVIYRCTEEYRSREWYDFALIEDPAGSTYIGQLLGFFRYTTPGFPSPKLVDDDKIDPVEIVSQGMTDDTIYVGIRASADFFSVEELESQMITPFMLTQQDDLYILPVECIQMPLLVARDIGGDQDISYLHMLPETKWALLFTQLIKQLMPDQSSDESGDAATEDDESADSSSEDSSSGDSSSEDDETGDSPMEDDESSSSSNEDDSVSASDSLLSSSDS